MGKQEYRENNKFYDINRFPKQEGILVFGISMSKITNSQTAKQNFEYCNYFMKKIDFPAVGVIFLYSDNLYLYSNENAFILKNRFQTLINAHKNEFNKILSKNPIFIPKSFSFVTWNQFILEVSNFLDLFAKFKRIYQKDKKLQKYVEEDIFEMQKEVNELNVNFILEEILLLYLIAKGKVRLRNDYVGEKQKWILNCYPGKPLKSEIYLFQKNFLKLDNKKNIYQGAFYDLKSKSLYEYDLIDLKTFK